MADFSLKDLPRLRLDKQKAIRKGDLKQVAIICNLLGEILSRNGKFSESLSEHEEEKNACEVLGDDIGVAVAHRKVGEVYCELGDYATALWHQHKHLDLARGANDLLEEQRALATLGRTYLFQAESYGTNAEKDNQRKALSLAKQAFIKSLAVCEKFKDGNVSTTERMEMKARLFLNIGVVCEHQNKTTQAIDLLKQALSICVSNELKEDLQRCYYSLADILYKHGDYRKALRNANLALATAKLLKNTLMQFDVRNLKAQIMLMLQDFPSAKHHLFANRKLALAGVIITDQEREELDSNLKAVIRICRLEDELNAMDNGDLLKKYKLYERMGDLCSGRKLFSAAVQFYVKAVQVAQEARVAERDLAPLYYSLSATYMDLKQFQEAIANMKKELDIYTNTNNSKEACKTLLNLANAEESNAARYETLKNLYDEAFKQAKIADSPRLMVDALHALQIVEKGLKLVQEGEKTQEKVKELCERFGIPEEPESGSEEEEIETNVEEDVDLSDAYDSGKEDSSEGEEPASGTRPRLRRGRQVEKRNEKGETALHRACIAGNLSAVRRLLQQGHCVNPRDNCGWLPLHEAANHDHLEIVALLLEYGAWVNDRGGIHCEGVTPLHDAASCGNIDVMRLLIEKGANVNAKTDKGETPLDCLRQWRKRAGRSIEASLRSRCMNMEEELQATLQRLGMEAPETSFVHDEAASPSPEPMRLSSDSEEESESWEQIIVPHPQPSASSAPVQSYLEAMENVGSKRKGVRQEVTSAMKPRQALVDENAVVDDWLEDDLKSQANKAVKRRRLDTFFTTTFSRSKETCTPSPKLTQKRARRDTNTPETSYVTSPNANDQEYHEDPPLFHPESSNIEVISIDDSREVSTPLRPSVPVNKQANSRNTRVKVRVLDKLLLIPVPDAASTQLRNVSWLAEEAAKRYQDLTGVRPVLTLVTKEGALLSRDDPVTMVLDTDEEVHGQVEQWHVPPAETRYVNACHALQANVNEVVLKHMRKIEASWILDMRNLALGPTTLTPLARALHSQSSLRELCLSSNLVTDELFKTLCAALPTMPMLTHLELRTNLITATGLAHLAEVLQASSSDKQPLQNLNLLDLSFNPLGNAAASYLAVCLRLLPLKDLRLEHCFMDNKLFEQRDSGLIDALNQSSVRKWHLGYNNWKQNGIQLWLRHLRADYVSQLSFSGGVANEMQAEHLPRCVSTYVLQRDQCCLTQVDLSRCHMTDTILGQLSPALIGMTMLEKLSLAANVAISGQGFLALLKVLQPHNIPIKTLNCSGCPEIWKIDSNEEIWETWRSILTRDLPIQEAYFAINDALCAEKLRRIWEEQFVGNSVVIVSSLGREMKFLVSPN